MAPCNRADLPLELLDMILQKIVIFPDYIRFGAVCKKWHLAALEHKQNKTKQMLPVLSIPRESIDLILFCWDDKAYPYQFPIMAHIEGYCSGSSHGWFAFDNEDSTIDLLKPFSRTTLHLPPVIEAPESYPKFGGERFIYKVILSRDPFLHPDNYFVAAIHADSYPSVALVKSGEQTWTYLEDPLIVYDICFYKEQLYVISYSGRLTTVDNYGNVTHLSMDPLVEKENNHFLDCSSMSYLVESHEGDLLLVRRFNLEEDEYTDSVQPYFEYTVGFIVYRLDSRDERKAEWVEIESLGNSILFLGYKEAVCISAMISAPKCKNNCIYYTAGDGTEQRNQSFGVYSFNLKSKQIEKCYEVPDFSYERRMPFWIFPTLS